MAVTTATGFGREARAPWNRRLSYLQDALLICVSALFVWTHASFAYENRNVASVFFAVEQAFLVVMFLTRRRTNTTSARPSDWFVATVGGWLPLALRPHGGSAAAEAIGATVQVVGLSCVLVCFSALGKSFGVVAANRGLKQHGPYSIVRHPIYVSHFITMTGFVIANLWWVNVGLVGTVMLFQVLRIRAEERVLLLTADYDAYRTQVRWRLIPLIY
jgi:protein-S-isoprenylcysteine O-methyltransferase Ste14